MIRTGRIMDGNYAVEDLSSGRSTISSSGSFTSYATLPNVDCNSNSEVLSTCDSDGRKLVQDRSSLLSLENDSVSTATLAYSRLDNRMHRISGRGEGVGSGCRSFSSGGSCSADDEECDRDTSSDDDDDDEDRDRKHRNRGGSDSDFSMRDCDLTSIVDDSSFKRSSPKNEAELMFLQVVEILRFEKKVRRTTNQGHIIRIVVGNTGMAMLCVSDCLVVVC